VWLQKPIPLLIIFEERSTSTALLVSPRPEGLDLIGLDEPEDEILKEPEQHLPMHVRQGTTRDRGGESPHQWGEEAASAAAPRN
jgi:hypothetical protein